MKQSALQKLGARSDARARARIEAAGWKHGKVDRRHVASRRVIEEDHSITMKYESDLTLEGLASAVIGRERSTA